MSTVFYISDHEQDNSFTMHISVFAAMLGECGDTSFLGWPTCLKLFVSGDEVYFDTQAALEILGLEKHVKKNGFKFIDKFLVDNGE